MKVGGSPNLCSISKYLLPAPRLSFPMRRIEVQGQSSTIDCAQRGSHEIAFHSFDECPVVDLIAFAD